MVHTSRYNNNYILLSITGDFRLGIVPCDYWSGQDLYTGCRHVVALALIRITFELLYVGDFIIFYLFSYG